MEIARDGPAAPDLPMFVVHAVQKLVVHAPRKTHSRGQ